MKQNENALPQKYVNTPFAYTQLQKGMTLLQQNVMMKVAEYLRRYLDLYFKTPALVNSDKSPKPIMTEQDLDNIPIVRLKFSELGISADVYSRVRKVLDEILDTKVEVDGFDELGGRIKIRMPLFAKIETPVTEKGTTVKKRDKANAGQMTEMVVDRTRGYIDLKLNKDVLLHALDMNKGYVTHPDDITRIGRVPNMPLMYYFARHHMQNFKLSKARITPEEFREYFGLLDRDPYGNITKVRYKEYRRLKAQVIKVALDDIKRVYDAGQIDFYFEMKEIRTDGRKTGDPNFLEFRKAGSNKREDAKYRANSERKLADTLLAQYPTLDAQTLRTIFAAVPREQWDDFKGYAYNGVPKAVEQPHRWNGTHEDFVYFLMRSWIKEHRVAAETERRQTERQGANEWRAFMAGYNGMLKEQLSPAEFVSLDDNGTLILRLTAKDWEALSEKEKEIPPISVQSFYHHLTLALGRKVTKIMYDVTK